MANEQMEQMPAEGAASEGAPAPSNDVGELVSGIGDGLNTLVQILSQVPDAPEGAAEALAGILDQYTSFVDQISGGAPSAEQGTVPPEAGSSGAAPMSPAGMPRG